MGRKFQKQEKFYVRVNDEIPYSEARVIYKEHGDTISEHDFNKVMRLSDARKIAERKGLDVIEINSKTTPPIVKIYEYSKYLYELKQVEKKKKKNISDIKEIQLSVNISQHDMGTKAKHAKEFIDKGNKVRVVLTMKGRELSRREESSKSFYEFLAMMGDNISYDTSPKNEGNKIITILKKKK